MVIVRLTIPIGVNPKDRLDVQVEVPPACGTKSLAGGYLLMTRLREVLHRRRLSQGELSTGAGAGARHDRHSGQAQRPQGRPRPGRRQGQEGLSVTLSSSRKTARAFARPRCWKRSSTSDSTESENGHQKGVATAKTAQFPGAQGPRALPPEPGALLPRRPAPADDRQPRAAERAGSPLGAKELLDPKTAGVAAMKLEGLGSCGIEPLKTGLKSPNSAGPLLLPPSRWPISMISRAWMLLARPSSTTRSFGSTPWRPWRRWTSPRRT